MSRSPLPLLALLLATGCYRSHGLGDGVDDDGPRPDGSIPTGDGATPRDGEVPACTFRWETCRVEWAVPLPAGEESRSAPDIAWAGDGVAVTFREGDQTRLARLDGTGALRSLEDLGALGESRIAAHPELGLVVAGDRALRWIGPAGERLGDPIPNRPRGAEAFGVDVAAVPGGYLLFAIPGGPGDPPALVAALGSAPETPTFEPFAMREPLLPFEHAEDRFGFATHVGFEAGPDGIFPLAFRIEGGRPGAQVGEGDRRGATTFLDGVVSLHERVFLYYQGFFPTLVELGPAEPTVFQLDPVMGTGNNGHAATLGDERVVLFLTETEGALIALPWEPEGGVGEPLPLWAPDGRRTRDVRSAPSPRGLLAAWECVDGICAGSIECCAAP